MIFQTHAGIILLDEGVGTEIGKKIKAVTI